MRQDKEEQQQSENSGIDHAGLFGRIFYSWVFPLLQTGKRKEIQQESALPFLGEADTQEFSFQKYQKQYQQEKKKYLGREDKTNIVFRTYLSVYWRDLLLQFVWACCESIFRVIQPLLLREFLQWLNEENRPLSRGLIWALALGLSGFALMVTHHQLFFIGMRVGFRARQQAINIVYNKVLKLNSQIIGDVSSGQVVNLVSNDARRFEDASVFWVFLIVGPLELIAVFAIVGVLIGWLPAFAGVSSLLALIPIQGLLAKLITKIRQNIAKYSDERVNLQSELISGILSVKMLSWERPMLDKVFEIRKLEQRQLLKMNMIRAFGMALQFFTTPLVSFVAFAVFWAQGGELILANVFSVIALLHLPKLPMATFFVKGVEFFSELMVTVHRVNKFMTLPEPPPRNSNQVSSEISVAMRGADFDWASRTWTGTPEKFELKKKPPQKHTKSTKNEGALYWSLSSLSKSLTFRSRELPDLKEIQMEDIDCNFEKQSRTLKGIQFQVKRGELIGICGKVGSGKSSLLAALLGEIQPVTGNDVGQLDLDSDSLPSIVGSIAYCQQVPWIISGSIRENIVFGQPFQEQFYNQVLNACALMDDLEMLPAGDQTEIGERGVNLSGGQKARLALARAAYSQATVQLLDDPLSAVDPRVGKILFNDCIRTLMKNSTRILVTHQRQYLPFCDRVFIMRDGEIIAQGPWEQLSQQKNQYPELEFVLDQNQHEQKQEEKRQLQTFASKPIQTSTNGLERSKSTLVQEESKQSGSVSLQTYLQYCKQLGVFYSIIIAIALLTGQIAFILSEYSLALWSQSSDQQNSKWIVIYGTLVGGVVIIGGARALLFSWRSLAASGKIHNNMVKRVLRAPLQFFHTNPTGRILNRFSKDLGIVDEYFPGVCFDCIQSWMYVFSAFLLSAIAIPVILPVFIPLFYIFYRVRSMYVQTSREVKRYEALTRSPVYAAFSSTLKGLPTIKAFQAENQFLNKFINELNLNGSWWFSFIGTSRWIGVRLDFICAILLLSCALLTVAIQDMISRELVALALTHVLQLLGFMQWAVRQSAELENNMTAVERLLEYCVLDQEAPFLDEGGQGPPALPVWPTNPSLKFVDVVAAYRPELEPVLDGLSFSIKGGESVGIVGRTGSGKSSLLLTLFRLINIRQGTIFLDDVDTSKIALDQLRRNIAVIPQDPVLFSGSVRSNLDPWNEYDDSALWAVLEAVQLKEVIRAEGGLFSRMNEYGENLSVGQRQLFCLARALLEDACVLALDEATANVDGATDALIQESLRKCVKGEMVRPRKSFSVEENGIQIVRNSREIARISVESDQGGVRNLLKSKVRTLMVIAHRIDTIMDCDQLLVLQSGRLVENGSPEYLQQIGGVFAGMVAATKSAQNVGNF